MSKQTNVNTENLQTSLVGSLKRAAGLLDTKSPLRSEVASTCNLTEHPTYRVAVFGPFNYGKSTLLNALLGEKALPMDLVPTTGAAIAVKYGPEASTRIIHTDGTVQEENGTSALEQFAVLDEQRRMRKDIAAVEVFCPHPLLKLGIELVDLPGTDDQQAQNDLVQQQLLSANLVIQVLDGRKLMTLAEREHLRDWLLDRGINNVVFVVNFLNLMEVGDRQQISSRLRFLAESFRAELPSGVSNLYQVDALPALRARLKGDAAAAARTGLPALESALQIIGKQVDKGNAPSSNMARLTALVPSVVTELQRQITEAESISSQPQASRRTEIQDKARSLIQQGFNQDLSKLRNWLKPENLKAHYRQGLAQALEQQTAADWIVENLRSGWYERQKPVVQWVHQACEFFDCPRPVDLWMAFSADAATSPASTGENESDRDRQADNSDNSKPNRQQPGIAPVAIATGLGWILGGPMGAAVLAGTSHLINQRGTRQRTNPEENNQSSEGDSIVVDFAQQADIYLDRFSIEALANVATYEQQANDILTEKPLVKTATRDLALEARINLIKTTLEELEEISESASS